MKHKQLIFKNVKRNIRHYFVYIFALTFSVALYFTFVTLQYDVSLEALNDLVEASSVIQVGSIFLVFIVLIFLMYANNLFVRRRSKELGIYQLVGMTKKQIFRLLVKENMLIFGSSVLAGIFIGFAFSKLLVMILFTFIQIETITSLHFSMEAFIQTLLVFTGIFFVICMMNHLFLKRQSILHLFQKMSTNEQKDPRITVSTSIQAVLGVACIGIGYFLSTKLFSGDFSGYGIFYAMFAIVALISVGTYLFFRGSIGVLLQLIRKQKDGHVSITNVFSLTTILFRIKSSALLLTIITLLSTLAITLTSIAYISYHSAEEKVKEMIPHDFSVFTDEDAEQFTNALTKQHISYTTHYIPVSHAFFDIREALVPGTYDNIDLNEHPELLLKVIEDSSGKLAEDEVILTKPEDLLEQMLVFKDSGQITLCNKGNDEDLVLVEVQKESVLPSRLSEGFPVVIVHEALFDHIQSEEALTTENEFPLYIGIDLKRNSHMEEANNMFHALGLNKWKGIWTGFESQVDIRSAHLQSMGLLTFITGFLGLTFLLTSGCILYFRQMNESDEEKNRFEIVRKLGFTEAELLKGIRLKQLMNFGIPLLIGLINSYFVVQSSWFIFGKEMWTPMVIVMVVYTMLYSIFSFLSIQYDKRVIRDSM